MSHSDWGQRLRALAKSVLLRRGVPPADAEEWAADVVGDVVGKYPTAPREEQRKLVVVAAKHRGISWRREGERRRLAGALDPRPDVRRGTESGDAGVDAECAVDATIEVREAMARLRAENREYFAALFLTSEFGLSPREIAKMMSAKVDNVYTWLSRGRKRLRELLSEEE
ncbi:MAG: hypothetical protein KDC87_21265 [Planctomycetes bacterium]|nr:hypothetical protein [Planctomycetota bacterium]